MTHQSAFSKDELEQRAYIKQCGERMADTIVGDWLEDVVITDHAEARLESLRADLAQVLTDCLDEIEIAETAAGIVGNPTFEKWREDNG